MHLCDESEDWIAVVAAMHASNPMAKVVLRCSDASVVERCAVLARCTFAILNPASGCSELLEVVHNWNQQSQGFSGDTIYKPCLPHLLGIDRLPQREQRLVLELGRGLLSKQISQNLALTPATVGTYRKTIAAKLGVSGPELVRIAALYRCLHSARASGALPGC